MNSSPAPSGLFLLLSQRRPLLFSLFWYDIFYECTRRVTSRSGFKETGKPEQVGESLTNAGLTNPEERA